MSKALMRTHLTASASFARRNGGSLRFAAIPDDADVDTSGLDFKAANREALFKLGYDNAVSGRAWREPEIPVEPPSLEHQAPIRPANASPAARGSH
jgi:hypothetical protein